LERVSRTKTQRIVDHDLEFVVVTTEDGTHETYTEDADRRLQRVECTHSRLRRRPKSIRDCMWKDTCAHAKIGPGINQCNRWRRRPSNLAAPNALKKISN